MQKELRLIKKDQLEIYEALLRLSYSRAKGFITTDEALRWHPALEKFPKIGVFHDDQLISTMRLDWLMSLTQLNYALQGRYSSYPHRFPIGCLTKGATHPDFSHLGLNALIRYHMIELALNLKLSSLVGTMVEGSPRVFSMTEMGYVFEKNPNKWRGHYESDKVALIGILDLEKNASQALNYIREKWPHLIQEYKLGFSCNEISIC